MATPVGWQMLPLPVLRIACHWHHCQSSSWNYFMCYLHQDKISFVPASLHHLPYSRFTGWEFLAMSRLYAFILAATKAVKVSTCHFLLLWTSRVMDNSLPHSLPKKDRGTHDRQPTPPMTSAWQTSRANCVHIIQLREEKQPFWKTPT